jgi:hypothetical protein
LLGPDIAKERRNFLTVNGVIVSETLILQT